MVTEDGRSGDILTPFWQFYVRAVIIGIAFGTLFSVFLPPGWAISVGVVLTLGVVVWWAFNIAWRRL